MQTSFNYIFGVDESLFICKRVIAQIRRNFGDNCWRPLIPFNFFSSAMPWPSWLGGAVPAPPPAPAAAEAPALASRDPTHRTPQDPGKRLRADKGDGSRFVDDDHDEAEAIADDNGAQLSDEESTRERRRREHEELHGPREQGTLVDGDGEEFDVELAADDQTPRLVTLDGTKRVVYPNDSLMSGDCSSKDEWRPRGSSESLSESSSPGAHADGNANEEGGTKEKAARSARFVAATFEVVRERHF